MNVTTNQTRSFQPDGSTLDHFGLPRREVRERLRHLVRPCRSTVEAGSTRARRRRETSRLPGTGSLPATLPWISDPASRQGFRVKSGKSGGDELYPLHRGYVGSLVDQMETIAKRFHNLGQEKIGIGISERVKRATLRWDEDGNLVTLRIVLQGGDKDLILPIHERLYQALRPAERCGPGVVVKQQLGTSDEQDSETTAAQVLAADKILGEVVSHAVLRYRADWLFKLPGYNERGWLLPRVFRTRVNLD